MFNIFGSHKIGIIGDANSGKTVFLTSLLWNLERGILRLGEHGSKPTSVKVENWHPGSKCNFDYAGNKLKLELASQQEQKSGKKTLDYWLDKTTCDYSLARCSYDLPRTFFRRDVTFVDIPGERLADVAIWECPSYSQWSERLLGQWCSSKEYSRFLGNFLKVVENLDSSWEKLTWTFKYGIRELTNNYVSQISPSTLLFDDGKLAAPEEVKNDAWLQGRPIWRGGDFFPLPDDWKGKEAYRECEKHYRSYRKNVIQPIFSQIGSCDSFIYCIDLFKILSSGLILATRNQEELQSFVNKVVPGAIKHFFKNTIGHNSRKIAFVATKSDMVYGDNLDKLEGLLRDLTNGCDQGKKLSFGYFSCTAWMSTVWDEKTGQIKGRSCETSTGWATIDTPPLPEVFAEYWNPEEYESLATPILPAKAVMKPAKQSGLDQILTFVTE